MVSGAYGGFSNVWGAQIMPFSRATFDRWPVRLTEMEAHYRVALAEMTLAGEEDDLSELFPLMVTAEHLPPLAERTEQVLVATRLDGRSSDPTASPSVGPGWPSDPTSARAAACA